MNSNSFLFRQIHPSWIQAGRVTSQAFRPTPKDENRLSVYDGDRINAEASWFHYTTELELESAGAMAVTNAECTGQGLSVFADGNPFPEHVFVDFSGLTKSLIEKKAKVLKRLAEARGWQYQAEG